MLAPIATPDASYGEAMVSRSSPSRRSTAFTSPNAVTIPVNISDPLVAFPQIGSKLGKRNTLPRRRIRKPRQRQRRNGRPPLRAKQDRRPEPFQAINKARADPARRELTAAFYEHTRDT